jgi:hypothetical protein
MLSSRNGPGPTQSSPPDRVSTPPSIAPQQALAEVLVWRHALDLQAIRVLVSGAAGLSGPLTKEADAYLFVMALRNFIRGIELIQATVDQSRRPIVDAGLAEFNDEIPNAVNLRDVLTHLDEYLQGQGRLQKRRPGIPSVNWTESTGPEHYALNIGVVGQNLFTLDIGKARDAARELEDAAIEAVHGD